MMARRAHQPGERDRLLVGAVVFLLVASVAPARWLAPNAWLGDLVGVVSAPVAQPARALGGWLTPASAREPQPEVVTQLQRQVDEYRTLYERARARNEDLLRQMEQLRLMVELNPSASTRLLYAPVIGAATDPSDPKLLIRAGRAQGVHPNDVVAVEGVQLFGAVVDVSARTSWIRPVTSRAQGYVRGLIMIEDGRGVRCSLRPTGDGALRGDAAHDETDPEASERIAVGQTVRLDDPAWPGGAQMLVLGRVESVEPAPDSPLRRVVVVRPRVALDRVTEVIVRTSESLSEREGGP